MFCEESLGKITGSPSSKYEHRRTSALLRNIRNVRICMGKKPIVSVTYENERISVKNSLSYLKCVLRLSCVVHGPIYGRFTGFCVNVFLSIQRFLFYWNPFIFVGYRNDRFFSPYKSLYFECYATMLMFADAHISSLGYLLKDWCDLELFRTGSVHEFYRLKGWIIILEQVNTPMVEKKENLN